MAACIVPYLLFESDEALLSASEKNLVRTIFCVCIRRIISEYGGDHSDNEVFILALHTED